MRQDVPIDKFWGPLFVSFVDTRIFKETGQNLNNVSNVDNVNNVWTMYEQCEQCVDNV